MGWPRVGKRSLNDEPENSQHRRDIYTVSRLVHSVKALLEREIGSIWIEGELSNLAKPRSGHWYFSLKDESAQTRCAMFRSRNALLNFPVNEGTQVVARARVGMYEPRGEFQLIVEHMELAGEGRLRQRFEALKRKLAAEGLFDETLKQDLPWWPRKIGVVTSPSGAAIRDVITVLKRRNPCIDVVIYPCAVQGAQAAPEVVDAIRIANERDECDVLIVGRGGGSLEDLWAFNEEAVAREIFASEIPIVSAVGHEVDFTIADLVADLRAATPSASAEICSPARADVLADVEDMEARLQNHVAALFRHWQNQLRHLQARLQHPGRRLEQLHQRVDELLQRLPVGLATGLQIREGKLRTLIARINTRNPRFAVATMNNRVGTAEQRLAAAMKSSLQTHQAKLEANMRALHAISPLATLERGYAILHDENGDIARDAASFKIGDELQARLARGRLGVTVRDVVGDGGEPD